MKETSDKMQIGRPTAETFYRRNPKKEFKNEKEELLESYANPKIVKERYRPQNIYAKKQNDIKIGLWRRKLRDKGAFDDKLAMFGREYEYVPRANMPLWYEMGPEKYKE
jgi:hypothetical protein